MAPIRGSPHSGSQRHLTVNGIIMDKTTKERHLAFLESRGIDRGRVMLGLPDNFAGIVEVGSRNRRNGFYSFKKDLPYRSLRLCELLAHYILIYDDGKVSACSCRDPEGVMEIGDITQQSLAEISERSAVQSDAGGVHAPRYCPSAPLSEVRHSLRRSSQRDRLFKQRLKRPAERRQIFSAFRLRAQF